jgi:hypothetical protein
VDALLKGHIDIAWNGPLAHVRVQVCVCVCVCVCRFVMASVASHERAVLDQLAKREEAEVAKVCGVCVCVCARARACRSSRIIPRSPSE